jgi:hypothetical protein
MDRRRRQPQRDGGCGERAEEGLDRLIRMEEKAWAVASPAPEVRRLKLLNNGASTDGTGGARGSDDGAGAEAGGGAGVVLVRCSSA